MRAIRVDRALAAQHDPARRLLARAEILRQVRAVFEPRLIGPNAVGREFRDQHMVGLGEDNGRWLDRCARPRPQIAAARWRPAEHEREGVDLIEDHDAAGTVAAVREQRSGFHKRLDIFGRRELEAHRDATRSIEQRIIGPAVGESGEQAARLLRHSKPLQLRALDHLQAPLLCSTRVVAGEAERRCADCEEGKDHQHRQGRSCRPEALADLVI